MKTLLLMRHAKSSWKDTELEDLQRPLNKRGRRLAPRMGELLRAKELVPQVIYSSHAVRTRQTAEFMAGAAGFTGDIHYMESLYLAEPAAYLDAIAQTPDTLERVMVIGHNPGLEGLLQMLSGRIEALPTAAIAYLALPIQSWRELHGALEAELVELLLPRELEEAEETPEEEPKKEKGKEKEKEKEKDKKKDKKDKGKK